MLEQEFVANQEAIKPSEAKAEVLLLYVFVILINGYQEEKNKVEELRGSPLTVGTLEEIIDDRFRHHKPLYLIFPLAMPLSQPPMVLNTMWPFVLLLTRSKLNQGVPSFFTIRF